MRDTNQRKAGIAGRTGQPPSQRTRRDGPRGLSQKYFPPKYPRKETDAELHCVILVANVYYALLLLIVADLLTMASRDFRIRIIGDRE